MTIILAIESSCDETGVGIAELAADGTVTLLADEVASSVDEHARFGGVVPEIASRAHLEALGPDDAPRAGRGGRRQARRRRGHHRARAGRCAAGGSGCRQGVCGRVAGAVLRGQPPRRAPGRRRLRPRPAAGDASGCWSPAGTPTCCTCGRSASRSSNSAAPSTTPRARPTTRSRGCSASAIPAARCSTTWPAPATATRSCSRAA